MMDEEDDSSTAANMILPMAIIATVDDDDEYLVRRTQQRARSDGRCGARFLAGPVEENGRSRTERQKKDEYLYYSSSYFRQQPLPRWALHQQQQ